jgi:hypothetical protein
MWPNAAVDGVAGGGVFSAIYSASFTRRKADANCSLANWKRRYSELKVELTQTLKAIEVVERESPNGNSDS